MKQSSILPAYDMRRLPIHFKKENTMSENSGQKRLGVCIPWEEIKSETPDISGDEELVRRVWEENDLEAYLFYWMCIEAF